MNLGHLLKFEKNQSGRFLVFMILASLFSLTIISACSSINSSLHKTATEIGKKLNIVDDVSWQPRAEAPKQYRDAIALLNQEKYTDALEKLDVFLLQDPTSPWTQAANLNSGRALEGLSRWSEAVQRYRGVVAATNSAPKLQAMALYRLSFCYEALGDEQSVVAVLHDLLSRTHALAPEIANAELPARLAGSYARVGNFDQAIEYYQKAESGISRLRKESHLAGDHRLPDWLPRTLYYMGSMTQEHMDWDNFEIVLRPLARSQVYLLEAAELGIAPWSEKAAKDLMETYNLLWNVIENPPVSTASDPIEDLRANQEKQWDRAILILDCVHELEARELPADAVHGQPSAPARAIAVFLKELDGRVQKLLAERPVGEGLTPDSERRRESVRGVVVTPNDSLERRFLRESKKVKRSKLPNVRDPNL